MGSFCVPALAVAVMHLLAAVVTATLPQELLALHAESTCRAATTEPSCRANLECNWYAEWGTCLTKCGKYVNHCPEGQCWVGKDNTCIEDCKALYATDKHQCASNAACFWGVAGSGDSKEDSPLDALAADGGLCYTKCPLIDRLRCPTGPNYACRLRGNGACETQCSVMHFTEPGCNADSALGCRWNAVKGRCGEQCSTHSVHECAAHLDECLVTKRDGCVANCSAIFGRNKTLCNRDPHCYFIDAGTCMENCGAYNAGPECDEHPTCTTEGRQCVFRCQAFKTVWQCSNDGHKRCRWVDGCLPATSPTPPPAPPAPPTSHPTPRPTPHPTPPGPISVSPTLTLDPCAHPHGYYTQSHTLSPTLTPTLLPTVNPVPTCPPCSESGVQRAMATGFLVGFGLAALLAGGVEYVRRRRRANSGSADEEPASEPMGYGSLQATNV